MAGPLDGMRIVDLTATVSGPLAPFSPLGLAAGELVALRSKKIVG